MRSIASRYSQNDPEQGLVARYGQWEWEKALLLPDTDAGNEPCRSPFRRLMSMGWGVVVRYSTRQLMGRNMPEANFVCDGRLQTGTLRTQVHHGLQKLEELVSNINDIIENRCVFNSAIHTRYSVRSKTHGVPPCLPTSLSFLTDPATVLARGQEVVSKRAKCAPTTPRQTTTEPM